MSFEQLHRWIGDSATAFHLWCAERELRLADTESMPTKLRCARERNLDLLRAYRQRGEYPRQRHDPKRLVPCFIDAEGRQCAVACLMHASGDAETASKVASEANFARIREMPFVELDDWAAGSGLTKEELARIQPGYPGDAPRFHEAAPYVVHLPYALWFLTSLALVSVIINSVRLFIAFAWRAETSLLGIVVGVLLIYGGFLIDVRHSDPFGIFVNMPGFQKTIWLVGGATLLVAIVPLFWPRAKSAAKKITKQVDIAANEPEPNTQIKKMDGWD